MEIQAENRRRASIIQEEGENGERMPLIPHEQSINGHGFLVCTDAEISLHTLLVKYFNDLLGRQSSERGRDEVTSFYVGDLFCIHLDTKYANF